MIALWPVTPDTLGLYWPVVGPLLQKAVDETRGEIDINDIYLGILSGEYSAHVVVEDGKEAIAAAVLEIREFSKKKVVFITLAGGRDMDKWYGDVIEKAEACAKDVGASAIYISGRRGWARKLADKGFKEYFVVIGKEVPT